MDPLTMLVVLITWRALWSGWGLVHPVSLPFCYSETVRFVESMGIRSVYSSLLAVFPLKMVDAVVTIRGSDWGVVFVYKLQSACRPCPRTSSCDETCRHPCVVWYPGKTGVCVSRPDKSALYHPFWCKCNMFYLINDKFGLHYGESLSFWIPNHGARVMNPYPVESFAYTVSSAQWKSILSE